MRVSECVPCCQACKLFVYVHPPHSAWRAVVLHAGRYSIGGGPWRTFRSPPRAGAPDLRLAIVGDLGRTRPAATHGRKSRGTAGEVVRMTPYEYIRKCLGFAKRFLYPHSTHTQINRNGSLTGFPLGVCLLKSTHRDFLARRTFL